MPFTNASPERVGSIPPWFVEGSLVEHGAEALDWIEAQRERHPAHARLALAILEVSISRARAESSDAGRGLLDHSIRVGVLALRAAPDFAPVGLDTGHGVIPWRDPSFRLEPADPMIPLLGLAHGLGLLEAPIKDEASRGAPSTSEQARLSVRRLCSLDETHQLQAVDRFALYRVITHHRAPSDYPIAADGRPLDDRQAALLALLIHASSLARAAETQRGSRWDREASAEIDRP